MKYQVASERIESGHYVWSYGRGHRKITTHVREEGPPWKWVTDDGMERRTLKELRAAWGEWAEERYLSDKRQELAEAYGGRPGPGDAVLVQQETYPTDPGEKIPPRPHPDLAAEYHHRPMHDSASCPSCGCAFAEGEYAYQVGQLFVCEECALSNLDGEANPMTAADLAETMLSWALRNRRDPSVHPWSDAVRVLRREGRDVEEIIRKHGA